MSSQGSSDGGKPGPSKGGRPQSKTLSKSESKFEEERRKREEHCKELSIRYSMPARMGQWFEQYSLDEEKCKENEKRRAAGLAFSQKQNYAIEYLNIPVQIAKHESQLNLNIPIQIESLYNKTDTDDSENKIVLGVLIMDAQIDLQNKPIIDENSAVTATGVNTRTRRNVFKCVPIDEQSTETSVVYGKDFYIRLSETEGPNLYLIGLVPHLNNFGETKGIPLALTTKPDRFCRFHITDPNPDRMITLKGTPVKTFECVCVVQSYSNTLLGVDINSTVTTTYCADNGTHCFTYRDSRHRITSENFWKFVTQAIDEGAGAD